MRILIVGINYAPELTGIGKYTGEMAGWLVAAGHEVRIVTAPPYYPEWRVADGYAAWRYSREVQAGVSIWRCPIWVPARPSGLKRLLHLASFALSSLPVMACQLFWRADVILAIEPPLFCAPAAWACARLTGAKAWLHVQDFEVDAAFELGILRAPWLRSIVSKLESWLMRRFDRVSTISPNMVQRLIQKKLATEKAVLFTNWVDIDAIFPLNAQSAMRQQLDIASESTVALYSGNMGEKQGLEIVLESAASLVGEQGIQFVLCGDGAVRQRLQQKYAGLPNVLWLPLQPLERLNDLLNMANIHLLPQRSGAEDLVMPSKLTGMLASGCPVVATATKGTQIAEVLLDCGVVVEPDNVEHFSSAILQLARDATRRAVLGAHAREYALRNWAKERVMQEFDRQLKGL
ncbi:MAG: glycosyltransferase WbuB [Cellvibrio sp.]|uniref:glycosyltransferase WbuB n=1 Tax=Cellvibrio sp. TaxID=1965322 RepID=UPI0027242FC1|nr:glycosyltransferase WbuB [Cellvibrio sp.]